MDFENLKHKMDAESEAQHKPIENLKDIKSSKMPIQKIRKRIKVEMLIYAFISIEFFCLFPFMEDFAKILNPELEINDLSRGLYYIFLFLSLMISLLYIFKLLWFLNKTDSINTKSREAVRNFIFDFKLTLEVYLTGVMGHCLILPVPVTIFMTLDTNHHNFVSDLFQLKLSGQTYLLLACGYILMTILFYYTYVYWIKFLYGKPLKQLEEVYAELIEEDSGEALRIN